MKTIEYKHTDDHSDWGLGEWMKEPDKMQYPDPATGLPCLIVRNSVGSLCGYVGVPEGHPCFGKGYSETGLEEIEVHGGLTYANSCNVSESEAHGICHVPAKGEPDHVWWFGFDCGHAWDVSPSMSRFNIFLPEATYKNIAFVKEQNALLAQQLNAMDLSH